MKIIRLLLVVLLAMPCWQVQPLPRKAQPPYDAIAQILDAASAERWMIWVEQLSGAQPIMLDGSPTTIATRMMPTLFDGRSVAFDFILQSLQNMGFDAAQIEVHTYAYPFGDKHPERNWQNIILTLPGVDDALSEEMILLTAHLDSQSTRIDVAPGADDNASGSAALLEAAYLLRSQHFARTIRLIWFTSEEFSRMGSRYFVADYARWLPKVQAVINLDMFAYDNDHDGCFEVHSGSLAGSQAISDLIGSAINTYALPLKMEAIKGDASYTMSDHQPFWQAGIPAVMVRENFALHDFAGSCKTVDKNPRYHLPGDVAAYLNVETSMAIIKATLATLMQLGQPLGACLATPANLSLYAGRDVSFIIWDAVNNAEGYRLHQWDGVRWQILAETKSHYWAVSRNLLDASNATLIVQAVGKNGCIAPLINTAP